MMGRKGRPKDWSGKEGNVTSLQHPRGCSVMLVRDQALNARSKAFLPLQAVVARAA